MADPAPYAVVVEPLVGKFRVLFYFWTRLTAQRQAFVQYGPRLNRLQIPPGPSGCDS
ncbi:hypothetical protein GCM10008959_23570 [Deinococcus seoulensis]|uniref:Uncharacterized protein n=1 Tax=Deinococcus seoulensis TaxID=1837379 RepID=A0ABQ2RUK3_9DEIO|nr:hypothetical protein GCM10008959_23570 [Deinococcus seoulensis]